MNFSDGLALEEDQAAALKSPRILCTLEKVCDWGSDSRLCCLSCPRLKACRYVCRDAEEWLITGQRCPDSRVEAGEVELRADEVDEGG